MGKKQSKGTVNLGDGFVSVDYESGHAQRVSDSPNRNDVASIGSVATA
jgi:hypothetical protein